MPIAVTALDHLVLNVASVAESAAWYERVLGMAREEFHPGQGKGPRMSMKFGSQKINLRPLGTSTEEWFTARHPSAGSQDLCFLTQSPPQQVVAHLQTCGIAIETGPVEKQGARGKLNSVYCRDPDGNLIEISSYA